MPLESQLKFMPVESHLRAVTYGSPEATYGQSHVCFTAMPVESHLRAVTYGSPEAMPVESHLRAESRMGHLKPGPAVWAARRVRVKTPRRSPVRHIMRRKLEGHVA
jgi:hypothetical protein